jgi:hypothetical protein
MAPQITHPKWYSIAEQASTEMDPAKLTILVNLLCGALDECGKPPVIQMLPLIPAAMQCDAQPF